MNRFLTIGLLIAYCLGPIYALASMQAFTLSEIDSRIAPIFARASNYPPQFDSQEQRAETEKELHAIIDLLDRAHDAYPGDREILKRLAEANALGHNLDFAGCGETAIRQYEELLRQVPNDAKTQYLYGSFLSGTAYYESSVPHLEVAIQNGIADAHYTLAFVYIKMGQPERALPEFKAYLITDPENPTALKMVRQIQDGTLRLRIRKY
jgi:tetratricopeptide (TPR) repeat protein